VRALLLPCACGLAIAVCGCGGPASEPGGGGAAGAATSPEAESIRRVVTPGGAGAPVGEWSVGSPAFEDGGRIPDRYTGEGENISPPLAWTQPPPGTVSIAVICDDPDAPRGTWTHWLAWNIPPEAVGLPEAVPAQIDPDALRGGIQGTNDSGGLGYSGPMPPPGPVHHYRFRILALDTPLNLPPRVRRKSIDMATEGHVLGSAILVGTYSR